MCQNIVAVFSFYFVEGFIAHKAGAFFCDELFELLGKGGNIPRL